MQLHNDFRMKLFRANILHKFVDKIAKSRNVTSGSSTNTEAHSRTRRMQVAANMRMKHFIKVTKLPARCYILIQDYEKVSFCKVYPRVYTVNIFPVRS